MYHFIAFSASIHALTAFFADGLHSAPAAAGCGHVLLISFDGVG